MFTPEQIEQLKAPLDRAHVKSRSQGGASLSYVEAYHCENEANRIFGFGAWDRFTEIECIGEREHDGKMRVYYRAKVRIVVRGENGQTVTREGCGYGSGIDRDVGQAHESALKEAESDAEKRALKTFGNPFGQALYDKAHANVVDAPSTACQTAETFLRGYKDPAEFRTFWDTNKDGWKANLPAKEYAHLVAVMKECAATFTPRAVNQ